MCLLSKENYLLNPTAAHNHDRKHSFFTYSHQACGLEDGSTVARKKTDLDAEAFTDHLVPYIP